MNKRFAFMISDGTGITIESVGNSLMSQFEHVEFDKKIIPYVDNLVKAQAVVDEINAIAATSDSSPIAFITIVNPEISTLIKQSKARVLDLFSTFIIPMEEEIGKKSSCSVGRLHRVSNIASYDHRIDAINFALEHDDGIKIKGYEHADIILIGVSRSGKTPSCLYMALQFGIMAANYPFTDNDLLLKKLPESLKKFQHKLFGLTIAPHRLQQIRTERRPNSQYASNKQCQSEINHVESIYQLENIPFINSTRYSIEEIVTKIMATANIERRI